MISPDLRFDHLDPDEWRRLRRLFRPAAAAGAPPGRVPASGRGAAPLLLLLDGGRTVAALRPDLRGGPPEVEDPASRPWSGPASLGAHRRAAGARVAAAAEVAAIARIAERLDARFAAADDLVAQGLKLAQAAKAELGRGLFVDPDPFSAIPVPSHAALQQTFDLLLPDDRSAGLFVFERGRLAASIVVEKRGGDLTRVTSARALGTAGQPQALTDFRDGRHRAVLDAMARHALRPHAAVFLTVDALREVLGPQPGALAQAVALRQAVIDPAPPWLVALAGAGAVAGVAQTAGKLLGRFVPQGIKDTARDAGRRLSPWTPLGFDPIQLFVDLAKLL